MFNETLYKVFGGPVFVRLMKGAIAAGISAAIAYLVNELTNPTNVVPDLILVVGTPLLLALDKFFAKWK